MSTRGLVKIFEQEDSSPLVVIYNHCDSYPSGLGVYLKKFIESGILVNGFSSSYKIDESLQFNGIGNFAAKLIAQMVKDEWSIYIYPASVQNEEYQYHIFIKNNKIEITCNDGMEEVSIE